MVSDELNPPIVDDSAAINEAARGVLADYLETGNPQYALLVDAPWGAGKTHFVRQETQCETNKDRLYVSLYGLSTAEEFDWAIVRALKPIAGGKAAMWGKQAKNLISGVQVAGFALDLNKVSVTEIILSSLPETLIFDDLERCRIPIDELFGLINRFVEHQKKKVILVANTAEHQSRRTYEKTREKLIGRVVRIEADPVAAIAGFWNAMPNGAGKSYLQENAALAIKVFREAGHNNLRLFRQSLVDAARMIDLVDESLRNNREPMERLLRTFLGLDMAFISGEITVADLKERSSLSVLSENKDSPVRPIGLVQKRHPEADILGYRGLIVSVDVGVKLIGNGYVSRDELNNSLRGTYHFATKEETPFWVNLWNWADMGEADVQSNLKEIDRKMDGDEITSPGILLQLFGAKSFMLKLGALSGTQGELADKIISTIERLKQKKLLPPYEPVTSRRGGYGFSYDSGTVSYGGFGYEIDDETRRVVAAMKSAQKHLFEELEPSNAQSLLDELQQSPELFLNSFDDVGKERSFSRTPILHYIDHTAFAAALLRTFNDNRDLAVKIGDVLKERRQAHRSDLAAEHPWFDRMDLALSRQANAASQILGAQIELYLRRHLRAN
ncbi:MAG: hypothetical protein E5X72_01615 [Mesorhizobium sp.]|nr:MAG: hypothetical protein E5X72_01615 [Mesorhizobium sp.]